MKSQGKSKNVDGIPYIVLWDRMQEGMTDQKGGVFSCCVAPFLLRPRIMFVCSLQDPIMLSGLQSSDNKESVLR